MTAEMQQVYESIVTKSEQLKTLEAEIKALKAKIIEYHHGEKIITEDGYESVIKHSIRDTPQPKAIAEKFNVPKFDYENYPECFKRTEYDSVSVKRLILG